MWQDVEQVKAWVAGVDAQVDTGGWCTCPDVWLREEWRVKQEDLAASTCYTHLTVWLCDLGIVPPPPPSKQKTGGGRRVMRPHHTRMRPHHATTVLRAPSNSAPHLHPHPPAAARLAAKTQNETRVVCGGRQDSALRCLRCAPGLWHSLVDSGGLSVTRTDRVHCARSSFFDGAATALAKWPPPIRSDDINAHHDTLPRPSSETVT